MRLRVAWFAMVLTAVSTLSASSYAMAATSGSTYTTPTTSMVTTTTGNTKVKVTYDLSWTLPTAGKSGCEVCHADKDLQRVQGGKIVSLYVNTDVLQASAHKDVPCTGCHTDFAYKTPHANVTKTGDEWRKTAKLSCKNCHAAEFSDYSASSHSPTGMPGETTTTVGAPGSSAPGIAKPLCGDCHGGHSIPASNNVEAQAALHASGLEMCGKCHKKDSDNFIDYYHGAAYHTSAPDAPSCWDCHGVHKELPSTDRQSMVYKDKLYDTCHKCHSDPGDGYISYAVLVHHKAEVQQANPAYVTLTSVKATVMGWVDKFKAMFGKSSS